MRRVLGLILVVGAGCSSPPPPACIYNFEGDVRSGPHAGLSMTGPLIFTNEQGALAVRTGPPAAANKMSVSSIVAAFDAGQLNLTFALSDGRIIKATGALAISPDQCSKSVSGALTGPTLTDSGDWTAPPTAATTSDYCRSSGASAITSTACPTLTTEWQISSP